jgi:hypothetical protein
MMITDGIHHINLRHFSIGLGCYRNKEAWQVPVRVSASAHASICKLSVLNM